MNDLVIREQELIDNPTARVPICLVLDTSGSMSGDKINELNEGIRLFYDAILNDNFAKYSAEIAIVTFGGNVRKILDFSSIEKQDVPILTAYGNTPMEEAVNLALDLLEQRKKEYSNAGVDYYQPWMVLMTDGCPDVVPSRSAQRTRELIENRKLTIFPIGIGPDADLNTLRMFSPKRDPLRLKGLRFKDFFEWLSKSVSRVSQSIPGERIELDIEGIKGWGEL